MKPTLFFIGSGAHAFPVHSYGFLIAIGLVVGVAISLRRGRSVGIETGATLDLTFYSVLVGLVGARLLYVLMHVGEYTRLCRGFDLPRSLGQKLLDCTAPLRFWQGGLVFLGGAVLSAVVMLLYARGETMKAIGETVGLSESRISQLYKALLERLGQNAQQRAAAENDTGATARRGSRQEAAA